MMNKQAIRICALCVLLQTVVAGVFAQSPVKENHYSSSLDIETHFRVSRSNLELSYMGNALALERFAQVVNSMSLDLIDSVIIVSQSSPEGSYELNMRLSAQRAATMRRAIEQRHPELKERLYIYPVGESWESLRKYVADDSLMTREEIDEVLRIIDSDAEVGAKKSQLKQLSVYTYLIKTYYPRIRNSLFCIVYRTQDFAMPTQADMTAKFNVVLPEKLPELYIVPEPPVVPASVQQNEPMFNVHTNLLYDLATAVNIGVEYYPRNSRWTVAANYTFPWWGGDKNHRYLQLIDGELEVRRYFDKASGHTGHYLMAYGHGNYYDLSFDAERAWQGEGWGVGLGYGYVWQPWKDKRWKVEAFLRVGYYHSLYDPYHASDPYNGKYYYDWNGAVEDFERRNQRFRWFGPTGLGVTLSYDLLLRKLKK